MSMTPENASLSGPMLILTRPFTWRSVAETISSPGMHRATRGKSFMYFQTWSTGAGMVNSFSISTFQSPSSSAARWLDGNKPYLVPLDKVHMTTRQYAHLEWRMQRPVERLFFTPRGNVRMAAFDENETSVVELTLGSRSSHRGPDGRGVAGRSGFGARVDVTLAVTEK